ncbi:hypothetical protein ACFVTF_22895 [Kitasatospora sp. NPDC057940]|uniref:hypothetical protein n=1 Tax=Kitasatospora sp. NPDC057940 TaxID=3346285 RepID=UPI0036D95C9E
MTSGELLLAGLHLSSLAAGGFTVVAGTTQRNAIEPTTEPTAEPPVQHPCSCGTFMPD